jgi:hypothetical protein
MIEVLPNQWWRADDILGWNIREDWPSKGDVTVEVAVANSGWQALQSVFASRSAAHQWMEIVLLELTLPEEE